jgi:hypothetical protein
MSRKFTDAYGVLWVERKLPNGEVRQFKAHEDHEDVRLEQKEILEERKAAAKSFWPAVAINFAVNAIILSVLVFVTQLLLPGVNQAVTAIIICSAYFLSVFQAVADQISSRVYRSELHALTVHDAVLTVQEDVQTLRERA